MHGHHAYNVTREHPWGLLIGVYIFFVVSSTGLCIVGSLGDVFGFKDYEMISKRAIFGSIVTIMAGFAVIAFEIGHPVTMLIYNVLSPGLTSAIWWMGTLYGLYLTFMIIEFVFLLKHNMKMAKIFGLTRAFGRSCGTLKPWRGIWLFKCQNDFKRGILSDLFHFDCVYYRSFYRFYYDGI